MYNAISIEYFHANANNQKLIALPLAQMANAPFMKANKNVAWWENEETMVIKICYHPIQRSAKFA